MHSDLQAELEHAHHGRTGPSLSSLDDAGVDRTAAVVAVRACVQRKSTLITDVLEEDTIDLGPDDFPCVVLEHCPANASGRGCSQCSATFSMVTVMADAGRRRRVGAKHTDRFCCT